MNTTEYYPVFILALDSGDTDVRYGARGVADYAAMYGCHVSGSELIHTATGAALFSTAAVA